MKPSKQWEERFQYEASKLAFGSPELLYKEPLIDFIRKERTTLLEEIRDELKSEMVGIPEYNQALQDAISIVEKHV